MAISLTQAAARHVTRYLGKRGKGVGVRLGVKTTGCSGLAYKLEYVDEVAPEDVVFEDHGLHRRHRTGLRARRPQRRLQVQQSQRARPMRLRRKLSRLNKTAGSRKNRPCS
jgi:hypothetical protein